jgi:tRNA dimethylallyltransferase
MQKTCIILAGPTAVGKTALAIQLAEYFSTEIISADSRQCYREISIGVAKPSADELEKVKHHFINTHSIHDELSAADFEQYALRSLKTIFSKNDIAIVTGGTGLYLKALCEGLDEIPPAEESVRRNITAGYEKGGMEWLQLQVQQKDPLFWKEGDCNNPRRMMRALEVMEQTGQSILELQKGKKVSRDFSILKIALELPRDILYNRINQRVNQMMMDGLGSRSEISLSFQETQCLTNGWLPGIV